MTTRLVIIALLLGLALIRIVNLEADFPPGINWSGDLYTDEGIYTSAALEHSTTGQWYRPNDYSAAVSQPVGHLVHRLVFALFGTSLFAARLTIILCFIQILILFYLLSSRFANEMTAFVVAGLLVTNFYLFAFSRLAILDYIMVYFIVVALAIALLSPKITYSTVILAGVCLALATLTKYSAIVGIPPILYIIWARTPTNGIKQRVFMMAIPGIVCLSLVFLYLAWAKTQYPLDFQNFQDALSLRSETSLIRILLNPLRALRAAAQNDYLIAIVAFVFIPFSLLKIPSYRSSLWVQALCIWIVAYFLLLSTLNYHPPRYFIMFTLPMVALVGIALTTLFHNSQHRALRILAPALIALLLGLNLYRVTAYLLQPEFTFVNMARDVARIMRQDSSEAEPRLIGNFAASLSLANGIPYVNLGFSNRPLSLRVATYHPTHLIVLRDELDFVKELEEWYSLEPLQSWDVFHNYKEGQPVELYKLNPK
jgi:4-amino-4-deoxy-L-arabinose transferase-like glycosyltransferase